MGDNGAILAGYTRELIATATGLDMHLFVKPDADLGDRFRAWDADACEWVNVNGWLFTYEAVETDAEREARETAYNADDYARDYPNGEPALKPVPNGWDHV